MDSQFVNWHHSETLRQETELLKTEFFQCSKSPSHGVMMLGPFGVEGQPEPAGMDSHTCVKCHGAVLSLALNPPSWSVGQDSGTGGVLPRPISHSGRQMRIAVGVGSVTITSDFTVKFPVSVADLVHDSSLLLTPPPHYPLRPLGMSAFPSKPPNRSDKGPPPAHYGIRPRQGR